MFTYELEQLSFELYFVGFELMNLHFSFVFHNVFLGNRHTKVSHSENKHVDLLFSYNRHIQLALSVVNRQ